MAIRYKVKVININTYLRIRSGPSLSMSITGKRYNGDTFIVDEVKKSSDGYTWFKQEGTNKWSCSKTGAGQEYIVIKEDLLKQSTPKPTKPTTPEPVKTPPPITKINPPSVQITTEGDLSGKLGGVPRQNEIYEFEDFGTFVLYNNGIYPKKGDGFEDYKTNYDSMNDAIQTIRENLNISSAYTRNDINKNVHVNFNRYRIEYPDLYLKNTIPVIFFTRPDINLFDSSGNMNSFIANDPRTHNTLLRNKLVGQLLTSAGESVGGVSKMVHDFNPLLSNLAQNLEIVDDSVDTLDTGETFTGYKMQYAKHNVKSITSGTLSIKFKETFDLAITDTLQTWVDYESNVYKGLFEPKREYVWKKELDYACAIYYFLLDQDGETIRFWTKYYGVFPVNVPKSAFGFDMGSQVKFPELNVSFIYIHREDLNPMTMVEFNNNAGGDSLGYKYLTNYERELGHSGKTWVGVPFVSSYRYNNGVMSNAYGYKLRYRKM